MQNRTTAIITFIAFSTGIATWTFVYALMQPLALTTSTLSNMPVLSVNILTFVEQEEGTGIREIKIIPIQTPVRNIQLPIDDRPFWERNEMICVSPPRPLQQGTGKVQQCELRKK